MAKRSDSEIIKKFLSPMLEIGEEAVTGLKKDLYEKYQSHNPDGEEPDVDKVVKDNFKVSDVVDKSGHQYVNLVQQGGGVLGIALLGFTYVLERMGIRFLNLAGTSAGAINSAIMAVVQPPVPNEPLTDPNDPRLLRSPIVLYYLAQKNLFDFVDGDKIARQLVKIVVRNKQFPLQIKNSIVETLVIGVGLVMMGNLLLLDGDGAGIKGTFAGLIVAYIVALLVFSRHQIIEVPVGNYLKSWHFIKLFFIVSIVLTIAFLMVKVPVVHGYRSVLGLSILSILMVNSIIRCFSKRHLIFIQCCQAVILFFVLLNGVVNSLNRIWILDWPFLFYCPENPVVPYRYLAIGGMALLLFLLLIICSVALYLLGRFQERNFGINPGETFHKWIAELMKDGAVHKGNQPDQPLEIPFANKTIKLFNPPNNVCTLSNLYDKLKSQYPIDLEYKFTSGTRHVDDGLTGLEYNKDNPPLSIVTTEIATENKVVFPKMWKLFYDNLAETDAQRLSPADFVRASMSIPVFFEPFRISDVPLQSVRADEWKRYVRYEGRDIGEAIFIDGGSLSNFPLNLLDPPRKGVPSLPVFGVRLQDEAPASDRLTNTPMGIASSIINTMRSYYDKDFLITHPYYEQGLADIDVRDFNWLNFNLPPSEQVDLFRKGAEKAWEFLLEFDWKQYKIEKEALSEGVQPAEVRLADTPDKVNLLIEKHNRQKK